MAKKLSQIQAYNFIKNRGGELLSTYISSREKVTIKCLKDEYIWTTKYNDIVYGAWCPKCAGNVKIPIEDIRKFILDKNGSIIDDSKYINAKSKIIVKCNKDNYIWPVTWDHLSHGVWCPKCAGRVMKSFDEIKSLVAGKNGKLLSKNEDLRNNLSKLELICEKNHIWTASYSDLINGDKWCPYCKSSKAQRKLYTIIENIFQTKCHINYKGFDWLKDKCRMEIDIWVLTIKLAIEYDGIQHFKPTRFGGINIQRAKEGLKKLKAKDKLKNKLIKQHPDDIQYFVRFNYKEDITKEYVLKKLKQNNIPIPEASK